MDSDRERAAQSPDLQAPAPPLAQAQPHPSAPPPPPSHSLPISLANLEQAVLQQPLRIASFSYDANRNIHLDDRAMRYYKDPPAGADLSYGLDKAIWKEDKIEHIDSILFALMAGQHGAKVAKADLVTSRGKLTSFCTLAFAKKALYPYPWAMNVMLLSNTLYIEEHPTAHRMYHKRAQAEDERNLTPTYYGYAFEQYCCASQGESSSDGPPGWSGDINTNEQWCQVVATRLADLRIILSGETDCVKPETGAGVELKSCFPIYNDHDEVKFERKMLRWHMHCLFLNTPHLVVGFRNVRGKLLTTQVLNTHEMPNLVRGKPHEWVPQTGLNFGAKAIVWLRETLIREQAKEDRPATAEPPVWRLELSEPFEQLTLRRLSDEEVRVEVQEGKDENRAGFLTREYYDWATSGFGLSA